MHLAECHVIFISSKESPGSDVLEQIVVLFKRRFEELAYALSANSVELARGALKKNKTSRSNHGHAFASIAG
jgi:hypothetical protein